MVFGGALYDVNPRANHRLVLDSGKTLVVGAGVRRDCGAVEPGVFIPVQRFCLDRRATTGGDNVLDRWRVDQG